MTANVDTQLRGHGPRGLSVKRRGERDGGLGGNPRRRSALVMISRIGFILFVLSLWQFLSGRVIEDFLISNPIDVSVKLFELLGDPDMHHNILVTAQELVLGWFLGSVAGAVVGWCIGAAKFLGEVLEPIIIAINGIPKVALAPMFLLWFGLGIGSKVAIASMIVFFLVFNNVYSGMRNVPRPLVDIAKAMGASRMYIVRRVVLPSVSVPLFAALRAGVPFAMIGVIAAEFISADEGLGNYSMEATQQFDSAGLFAALVIIVAMVVVGGGIIGVFQRRALAWMRD
jgi:NitT/TauT family transport system permease protein